MGAGCSRRLNNCFTERSVALLSRLKTLWHRLILPSAGIWRLASESLDRDFGRGGWVAQRSHLLYCAA
jgi:hypothetical protein